MPTIETTAAASSDRRPARFTGAMQAVAGCALATVLGAALLPAGGFGCAGGSGAASAAAPEPSPVPVRWEFDFKPGPLRLATVTDEAGNSDTYFYMTYVVTNYTGQNRLFAPLFELATDEGELVRAGRGVPGAATREIINRLRNPLLEDPIAIIGTLSQGEENAKHGIAIWPAERLGVDEINVYAAGFSGESETYRAQDPETGRYRDYVLRKTLMLRHASPGELTAQGDRPFERVETRWVMR